MERFSFTIRTKKAGFEELTWLAASFDDQDKWVAAIESHLSVATGASALGNSPDGNTASINSVPVDTQGWLDMAGKTADACIEKYVSVSTKGFSWDDGESESKAAKSPQADIRMKLVAESAEAYGAWIVALKWLEGGCKGPPPRDNPRMCVTNAALSCQISVGRCLFSSRLESYLQVPRRHPSKTFDNFRVESSSNQLWDVGSAIQQALKTHPHSAGKTDPWYYPSLLARIFAVHYILLRDVRVSSCRIRSATTSFGN